MNYKDRRPAAAGLKPIYPAVNEDAALAALGAFEASEMGRKHPATAATWRAPRDRSIPFLEFAPALRKVNYTTNAFKPLNYQLRKIVRNRGHLPNDAAAVKLLWLSMRTIEDKRARQRGKAASKTEASASPRPIEGSSTQGWKGVLGALVIVCVE